MIAKRMADTETLTRQAAEDGVPARTGAAQRAIQPVPASLTYGSWMELGLAARQLMAASQPREPGPTRSSRRR